MAVATDPGGNSGAVGTTLLAMSPAPRAPLVPAPQQRTAPSASNAQLCAEPQATAFTPLTAAVTK
jgi:hypothetical protein